MSELERYMKEHNIHDAEAIELLDQALRESKDVFDRILEMMDKRNLSMRQIEDAIADIPYDDGTKEFWSANHDLLDATEQWTFDYADMGYSDKPTY